MTALSVLDLMMIGEGKTFTDTLDDSVALARHVKAHGYKRYWVAEHHDLPGIASSATTLLVQHLAAATHTLPLERINEAFDLMHEGKSIRTVIKY